METNATIENLQVVSETKESVILTWNTINTTQNSEVTVLYSKYGEKDLLLLNADSSKNQVTINGLLPGRQYIACVCPKGMPPQKDQCITFSTDRVEEEGDSQGFFLMVNQNQVKPGLNFAQGGKANCWCGEMLTAKESTSVTLSLDLADEYASLSGRERLDIIANSMEFHRSHSPFIDITVCTVMSSHK
ncbi:Leucine-rich repeat; immunoglobulin-like domain and transmembrane domain-containing protein 3 [Camelus dromedarius]|uniref:Leucine-rich repeat n=1 Tax=Camelus dromedarius TaxID=9838 RepID=A0A5N4EGJ8_CAMDR|nr:Leucine-rich repeat; immunoglobulin-like domain and transmembrane domain-containing protein 3 [Camelus dromedarius]